MLAGGKLTRSEGGCFVSVGLAGEGTADEVKRFFEVAGAVTRNLSSIGGGERRRLRVVFLPIGKSEAAATDCASNAIRVGATRTAEFGCCQLAAVPTLHRTVDCESGDIGSRRYGSIAEDTDIFG